MFNIAEYLTKFKNIGQSEKLLKEAIISVIKEVVGINLQLKEITIKGGEIVFKISPAVKNAIYIKKESILNKIKEKNIENINNIR